jgi:ribosomal protein L40E
VRRRQQQRGVNSEGGNASPGGSSHTSDDGNEDGDIDAEEEEFLEERRWDQLADNAAVCDLCQVPWPDDSALYCVVCGYRKPESIGAIAKARTIARELEHISPVKHAQHSHAGAEPPAGGPSHHGLLGLLEDIGGGGGGGGGASSGPGSPSARRRAETTDVATPRREAVDQHHRMADHAKRRVAATAEAASAGPTCPGCRCAVGATDRVCMRCGTQLSTRAHGDVLNHSNAAAAAATDVKPHSAAGVGALHQSAAAPAVVAGMVRCNHCNKFSPAGATTCITCDAPIQATASVGGVGGGLRGAVVAQPHDLTHVMVCMSCSKTNPKHARFCNWCGFKAPLPVQQVQLCPSCRTENLLSDRFCSDCGGHMPVADTLDGRDAVGGGDHSIMRLYDELEDGSVAHVATTAGGGGTRGGKTNGGSNTPSTQGAYAGLSEHDRQILAEARGKKKKMRSTAVQTGLCVRISPLLCANGGGGCVCVWWGGWVGGGGLLFNARAQECTLSCALVPFGLVPTTSTRLTDTACFPRLLRSVDAAAKVLPVGQEACQRHEIVF